MKLRSISSAAGFLVFLLAATGCHTLPANSVTQYSTIDALLAGAYDGQMPCRKLTSYGDFGIGTFDKLDGEMILLDGKVRQIKSDGKVYEPSKETTTPFASVTRFVPDRKITLTNGTDFSQLQSLIDKAVENTNILYAIKVTGRFSFVKTRSVPAQKKPYPPLTSVTQNQPTFEIRNTSGTLAGFRLPPYVKGINVPGYHVHFLSDDGQSGGHLLEFSLLEGEVQIAPCRQLMLILPEGSGDFSRIDLSRDRTQDLERAEKSK